MASFRAYLSPNEDTTLRRIAAGTSDAADVREADVKRLVALGLVEEIDGLLTPTERGIERSQIQRPPQPPAPPGQRRLKPRKLPL